MQIKKRTKDRPEPIIAMGTNDQYTTVDFGAMTKELVKKLQKRQIVQKQLMYFLIKK